MSKSRPRLYSKTGFIWLGVITSLLIASSLFTLFRVKSVITELTYAKVEGESQQVIEKFMIIVVLASVIHIYAHPISIGVFVFSFLV